MHAILIAGAALVGLPILLHLIMKQEPKRLTFPAFRFLKQKLKTNQRKLRLRHFILLALRMLIIALFALLLYQPTLKSNQLNIRGEQPIATVIIIDTTPSMGYVSSDKTRLKEATQRASELIKELPDKSPIAILDTSEDSGLWLPAGDRAAPQRRLDELNEPKGGKSITATLTTAYQLLASIDKEIEAPEPLPKLVVVFTDRTMASWEPNRTEDLKKLRDSFPDPKPVHVVLDFGVNAPANVSILSAEMKPQLIAAHEKANVTLTIGATGGDGTSVDATILAKPLWNPKSESYLASQKVSIPAGQTRTATFEFRDLKPGLHQIEFSLERPDPLAFDDKRFFTFKVGEARRILTISDTPPDAVLWQAAHNVKKDFTCYVVEPKDVEAKPNGETLVHYQGSKGEPARTFDIGEFEVVCLLNVENPQAVHQGPPNNRTLWQRLQPYLQSGGKLIVMPGPKIDIKSYNVGNDLGLMPGKLDKILVTEQMKNLPQQKGSNWGGPRPGEKGVTWVLDDNAFKHPMLKIMEADSQRVEKMDVIANPRVTKKYWNVELDKAATPVVYYFDAEKPADRHPAIVERSVLDATGKPKGKVLLLTTQMDGDQDWNDYWEQEGTSWWGYFPLLLMRYLAGDATDAIFNYPTSSTVSVPVPRSLLTKERYLILQGRGISGNDARPTLGEKQTELRIGPPKTNIPGNFALTIEEDKPSPTGSKESVEVWKDGFSVNVPPEESNLEKVPVEAIEELTGKDRVFAIERNTSLRDWLEIAIVQPVDLFPWLLIGLLLLFVMEGLAANRFYRRQPAG